MGFGQRKIGIIYIYVYICIVYVKILVISRDLPTKVWGFITGDAIG
jgi:hypothetical protein